ncbi:MAG: D-alanine--D-alanine ligase [Clostridia bacterium]|nr:D-alanine--D-alanine ligase [Clostridia bacterium]
MINLAVIYGGESCERDISIITAVQIMGMIDRSKYAIYPVLLEADGSMKMIDSADRISSYIGSTQGKGKQVHFEGKSLIRDKAIRRKVADIDCALLCTHGGKGESGSLQGLLEMHNIPYTSPNVEVSALCMNKALSKGVFSAFGAEVLPCILLNKDGGDNYFTSAYKLGYPLIVKPARQGSSIGISVAKDEQALKEAVEVAFEFDSEIIIEKALTDYKEINCACVYSSGEILASSLERPVSWNEFLTFDDKYMADGKINAGEREFPAKLPPETAAAVRDQAVSIYKCLNMRGVVRMDFLIDNTDGKAYINEVNTIPGSLANYLFKDKGIDGGRLIDIVVSEAIAEYEGRVAPKFGSGVLARYSDGGANGCKSGCKRI